MARSSVTAGRSSQRGTPILILSNQSDTTEVPVEFLNSEDAASFERIVAAPSFISWANSYLPREQQLLKLQKILVRCFEESEDGVIELIRLDADVIREPEMSSAGGPVLIRGPRVGVLVILRVPPGASTANTTPGAPAKREYVLFVRQARAAVGAREHKEIPTGHMVDGVLCGEEAGTLAELCGLHFHEAQMDDMTSLALSGWSKTPARSLGVSVEPSCLDARVRLFLYRETVTSEFIATLQKKSTQPNEQRRIGINLWSLNDAWRVTSDAKSLAALLLFHELNYHGLMPRYRAPRQAKRTATFICVGELQPLLTGFNLRVRVASPLEIVPHPERPTVERGIAVVGDNTGTIRVNLDATQVKNNPCFRTPGTPIFLRNVMFDGNEKSMVAILHSDFSKVTMPTGDELEQFKFEVNCRNDVSSPGFSPVYEVDQPLFLEQKAPRPRRSRGSPAGRGALLQGR